jgi:hypothetical protein
MTEFGEWQPPSEGVQPLQIMLFAIATSVGIVAALLSPLRGGSPPS